MAEYRLRVPSEPLAVQFAPINTPMIAWYAFAEGDERWVETRPVLGVLIRHEINASGEITDYRVEMAVQYEDSGELVPAFELDPMAFLGVYPAGRRPSDAEIDAAVARYLREVRR